MTYHELASKWRWKVPNGRMIAMIMLKNHLKKQKDAA
jgi:hypothetical protein